MLYSSPPPSFVWPFMKQRSGIRAAGRPPNCRQNQLSLSFPLPLPQPSVPTIPPPYSPLAWTYTLCVHSTLSQHQGWLAGSELQTVPSYRGFSLNYGKSDRERMPKVKGGRGRVRVAKTLWEGGSEFGERGRQKTGRSLPSSTYTRIVNVDKARELRDRVKRTRAPAALQTSTPPSPSPPPPPTFRTPVVTTPSLTVTSMYVCMCEWSKSYWHILCNRGVLYPLELSKLVLDNDKIRSKEKYAPPPSSIPNPFM